MMIFRRSSSVNLPPEEKKKSDHKPKKIDMDSKNNFFMAHFKNRRFTL